MKQSNLLSTLKERDLSDSDRRLVAKIAYDLRPLAHVAKRPLLEKAVTAARCEFEKSVPVSAIGSLLSQAMDIAVANGANSVSMPDEYVEIAAWLSGFVKQE